MFKKRRLKSLKSLKIEAKKKGYITLQLEDEDVRFSKEMLEAMTDEIWSLYARSFWSGLKRDDRADRCSVRGKNGKAIRCPDENDCDECPYVEQDPKGNLRSGERTGGVLSLEFFKEMGVDIPGLFNVEKQAEKRELIEALHKAVTELPEGDYTIIALAAGGMSEREIANKVGSKQRTINDQKRRIRTHLKKVLEDYL